jgi:hypothetical protein
MASVVDICNLALSHIANAAEVTAIDPPDGSAEADHCNRFYPVARDECLEHAAFTFTTRRESLAELADNPLEEVWAYAYALPNQCIRPLSVHFAQASNDADTQDFEVETLEDGTQVLYTNAPSAVLRFIWRQEDTTRFTPKFVVGLSTRLASYLAGAIPKDMRLKQGLRAQSIVELNEAAASDKGKQSSLYKDFIPAHLQARE